MQPPVIRHAPNGSLQIRPHFAAPQKSVPTTGYPKKVFYCKENEDSPMDRACHKPHELCVRPLRSDTRYRENAGPKMPAMQGGPNNPYLAPHPLPRRQHMVSTWE